MSITREQRAALLDAIDNYGDAVRARRGDAVRKWAELRVTVESLVEDNDRDYEGWDEYLRGQTS